MVGFDRGKRRIFMLLTVVGLFVLFTNLSMLSGTDVRSKIKDFPLGGNQKPSKFDTPPDPNVSFPVATSHQKILNYMTAS